MKQFFKISSSENQFNCISYYALYHQQNAQKSNEKRREGMTKHT